MLLTNIDILLNKTKHATTILLVHLIALILPVKILGSVATPLVTHSCKMSYKLEILLCFAVGETIASEKSEKLLGLHINSSFKWDTHIEKLVLELKKRLNLLEWLFYMKGLDLSLVAPKISLNLPLLKVSVKRVSLPKTKSWC